MKMLRKESGDWCHLCGKRKNLFVEISYPENAEHGEGGEKYVRMCSDCIEAAALIVASR